MIVAGFGFRATATVESLRSALAAAARDLAVDALSAPDDKANAGSLQALAAELAVPLRALSPEALQAVQVETQSARIQATRHVGSVAEAAALAAVGAGGRLIGPRQISSDRLAACAVAIGEAP